MSEVIISSGDRLNKTYFTHRESCQHDTQKAKSLNLPAPFSAKTSTIQPPPAPDATAVILAFSPSGRQAFGDFLGADISRYWITREKGPNIAS
jgi:hypothetical protein